MLFHLQISNLRSDHYSLCHFKIQLIFGVISQLINEYWSDRKLENGTWKSI